MEQRPADDPDSRQIEGGEETVRETKEFPETVVLRVTDVIGLTPEQIGQKVLEELGLETRGQDGPLGKF